MSICGASPLDHRDCGARGSAVAIERPFGDVQQKCLGRRDPTFDTAFLDRDHLTENRIVRRPVMAPSWTALRVAAPALLELSRGWRSAIADFSRLAHHEHL